MEDETRLRQMLSSAIAKMGFYVVTVASAEEAVRAMRLRAFDIAVLDLNLPGESGLDFLARLRAGGVTDRERSVQAIVLTGFGDLPAARKAIHLDVVEFLTKPCALGDLEAALGRAFTRRRGHPLEAGDSGPAFATEPQTKAATQEPKDQEITDASALEDVEREHIVAALARNNGNRAATATELGISLRKLYYRLNDYQRRGLL